MRTIGAYAAYATTGGAFGYWLQGVEARQTDFIEKAKLNLMEKRRRVLEQEIAEASS